MAVVLGRVSFNDRDPRGCHTFLQGPVKRPHCKIDVGRRERRREQIAPPDNGGLAHLLAPERPKHDRSRRATRGWTVDLALQIVKMADPETGCELRARVRALAAGPQRKERTEKANFPCRYRHLIKLAPHAMAEFSKRLAKVDDTDLIGIGCRQSQRKIKPRQDPPRAGGHDERPKKHIEVANWRRRRNLIGAIAIERRAANPAFAWINTPIRVDDDLGQNVAAMRQGYWMESTRALAGPPR